MSQSDNKDAILKAVRQWEVIDLGYDGLWLSPVNKGMGFFDKNECPITVIEASAFERLLTVNAGLVEALEELCEILGDRGARSEIDSFTSQPGHIALEANERAMQEIVSGGVG